MKKVLILLLLSIGLFLVTGKILAQTATPSSLAVNLTFPITELGNCSSASDCKAYCDEPTHTDACVAYAKEKGFYHESILDTNSSSILSDAKTELGCDSASSCETLCQDSANQDKCEVFAKQHNLSANNTSDSSNITLEEAKTELGCSSVDSCKAFCSQDTNKDACAAFAKKHGLRGGKQTVGPGGCTSQDSCKEYCSNPDNFQTCSNFMQNIASTSGQTKPFTGPGGCKTEEACRAFCTTNPTICHRSPSSNESSSSAFPHGDLLNRSGTPLTKDEYCHMYPSHCIPSASSLTPNTTSYATYCQSKGCQWINNSCSCPPSGAPSGSGETEGSNVNTQPPSPTKLPSPPPAL